MSRHYVDVARELHDVGDLLTAAKLELAAREAAFIRPSYAKSDAELECEIDAFRHRYADLLAEFVRATPIEAQK